MISDVFAIDTHTHINHGSEFDSAKDSLIYDATLDYIKKMNDAAKIKLMFASTFSSVLTTKEVEKENIYMQKLAESTDYLYQWVVIDPRNDNTFLQADEMLKGKKCVGIKLHPPYHQYTLKKFGDKLFSYANEKHAIVQIHPETDASYILEFANKYKNATFIMAHVGSYGESSYADAIEFSKHGNVYVDTSGSASTRNKIIEYTVERVGSEKILFGTDTYAVGFQRGRIEYSLIPEKDKENILFRNASKLFFENKPF